VGYNHSLTANTQAAEQWIAQNPGLGRAKTLSSRFREHWGGIFAAHPWLDGPSDTYLGFSARGGGASGEHSHAIHIWQQFAHVLGQGRISEVSAMMDWVNDGSIRYDSIAQILVRTEKGLIGDIFQDVVTEPARKQLRIQWEGGFLEWEASRSKNEDWISAQIKGEAAIESSFPKTRPDDFAPQMEHLEKALNGSTDGSPISLQRGLETMLVIAAAHESDRERKAMRIDYGKGYAMSAIRPVS
jgi:predicted dehydrogenase